MIINRCACCGLELDNDLTVRCAPCAAGCRTPGGDDEWTPAECPRRVEGWTW